MISPVVKYGFESLTIKKSRKIVLNNLFSGQKWRNTYRKQTYGHGERGREGGMYRENNMETYITIYKIDSKWDFAVCLRELKLGLYISLKRWNEGADGRDGTYVNLWPIHVEV